MFDITYYTQKYSTNSKPTHSTSKRCNSSIKYAEYACDISVMQDLLMKIKDLNLKHKLMNMLDQAERKKQWHYRQENFDVATASRLIEAFKNAK